MFVLSSFSSRYHAVIANAAFVICGGSSSAIDMRNINWKEQVCRAVAVVCMLYAVTIIADTARAAAIGCACVQAEPDAAVQFPID